MLICQKCWKPNEGEKQCTKCGGDFKEGKAQYSMKQWGHWIESLRPNMAHDFYPHEFSEDGKITRGGGRTGSTGNNSIKDGKQMRRERRLHERKAKNK